MNKQEIIHIIIIVIVIAALGIFTYLKKGDQGVAQTDSKDMDQQVINQLIQHGSISEKDHLIELAFFGDWSDMNKVRDTLMEKGYKQILNQSDKMLVMSTYRKLNLAEIKTEVMAMETIAKLNNVEFDGWSAEIVKWGYKQVPTSSQTPPTTKF